MGDRPNVFLQKLAILIYAGFLFAGVGAATLLLLQPWSATFLALWCLWKHMAEYFPTNLIRTAELDSYGRYIFVYHPHGLTTISTWVTFDCEAAGFARKFPGISVHPLTLTLNFRIPFAREFLLLHGVCDASAAACTRILRSGPGAAILLAVGGAAESLLAEPGTHDLVLDKRKGFVRIALQTGASLVPCYGFGENDLYEIRRPGPGSVRGRLQRFTKRYLGIALPEFEGEGIFWGRGILPKRVPLNVVVGAPIDVPRTDPATLSPADFAALVDEYHQRYGEALFQLWNAHKEHFARTRRRSLRIVE